MPGSSPAPRREPSPADGSPSRRGATVAAPDGVSARFWSWLVAEPLAEATVLDVGTGSGRLALALAPRCRRVIGIDRDAGVIAEATRRAAGLRLQSRVDFVIVDAESGEYGAFAPDAVTAHLCMSDAIAERAARALAPGALFAFVAFHADQWRETGRRSRFAYDEAQAEALLDRLGFAVEHLEVEQDVQRFATVAEGLAAALALQERWKTDGRWFRYLKFLEEGGRTLTRSHLLVAARRR
jgi:SAM-dependent methyltransferase